MQYVRSEYIAFIHSKLSNQIAFNGLVKHPISSFQFEFTVRVCVFALVFGPHQFMLSEHTVQFCSALLTMCRMCVEFVVTPHTQREREHFAAANTEIAQARCSAFYTRPIRRYFGVCRQRAEPRYTQIHTQAHSSAHNRRKRLA